MTKLAERRIQEERDKLEAQRSHEIPLLRSRKAPVLGTTEITRAFTYKLNVGNYESRDFYCCQKVECLWEDSEEVADRLYAFCKRQVLLAVAEWKQEHEIQPRRTA